MTAQIFKPHFSIRMKQLVPLIIVSLALASGLSVRAQDLAAVSTGVSADLQKALSDLAEARKQVEAERLPMARTLTELEQKLIDRKAEYAKAQRFQDNQLVELNQLKQEARRASDEVKYIDALITEYGKAFRSRLSFIEEPRHVAMFDAVDKAAVAPDLAPAQRFAQRTVLLTTSLARAEAALGGELFDGRALDLQGRVQPGKVALIGPVAAFADTSGQTAGLLQQVMNKTDPSVADVDEAIANASRTLVTTGSGQLSLDPTLGNAFKLSALKETLYEKIAAGGWVMAPLIAMGLASILVALVKWFQFSRVRLATEKDLQTVLRHVEEREQAKALAHARSIRGFAGDLLATAVEHVDEKKEYIEEVLYEKMLAARTKLERGLAFLSLTATVGPLMGLLGTVMGMIATFKLISSFGSGDPKVLAAGISEALIATASGMVVAIPALLLHAFLSRKCKGIIGSMEQTAVGFINGVPNEEKTFA
jgi:biopolymer transport protein ExbB